MRVKIAPSVAAADLSNLGKAVQDAEEGGADMIHLDVADGLFAPNITFGPATVMALRKYSDLPFDTHLMITDPLKYAEKFLDSGSNIITAHAEVLTPSAFDQLSAVVRRRGARLGLALKPSTKIPSWALQRLEKLDLLLVMTVNPGFSGQKLIEGVLPELKRYSLLREERGNSFEVEVDGGVEPGNVREVVSRGATIVVAGASVFRRGTVSEAIKELRERAERSVIAG